MVELRNAEPEGSEDDVEGGLKKDYSKSSSGSNGHVLAPLVPGETPFFHLDLVSAVRSAESGLPDGI